eukprot:g29633.t1
MSEECLLTIYEAMQDSFALLETLHTLRRAARAACFFGCCLLWPGRIAVPIPACNVTGAQTVQRLVGNGFASRLPAGTVSLADGPPKKRPPTSD